MFALKKILNGRINVAEPISMRSGVSAETEFKAGTAVKYTNGVLGKVAGDDTAEFVVLEDKTCSVATDEVLLILVTKEMLFDAPAAASVTVGTRVQFNTAADGVTATAVENGFGAYIMGYADGVATVRLA